jgi:hypothetical protein
MKKERVFGRLTQCTPFPESPLYVYLPKLSLPFVMFRLEAGIIWLRV